MTKLETELRELLLRYGFNPLEINIIFTHTGKDILEIIIENIEEENGDKEYNISIS